VLEEGIGSVISSDIEMLRVLDHYPKKRAWKRFNERPVINRHSVGSALHVGMSDNVMDAFVGVLIQQLANRCAGLARLANERTKAARQHPLGRAISTNNIEASPDRAVERGRDDRPNTCNLRNCALAFWFDSPKAQDLPRDYRGRPIEPTYRT
jgi:hypothetical protein